ncbi:MAG: VWA domain-containing protein [Anaerolineae bacterium]|nr:VWA domain-containing protein [Anaerolineae bacterium]
MAYDGFDPYSVLGIAQTATAEEVKLAYRRLARRLHPDANRNPGAGAQFQYINKAYEMLSDPAQRQAYEKAHASDDADRPYFTLRVTPSRRRIAPLDEPQVVYLLADIIPDPRATEARFRRDTRLNLVLALDRSNSMNGARLNEVKIAAHQIIDHLNEDDIFSIVAFSDRAEVIIPATPVNDKPAMKARVSMMTASGGTEIFQGLNGAVAEARRYLAPRLVNHILLLTDGHTFGDQPQSLQLARTAAQEGIVVSAMGLGQEWNDEFLDELASATGGTSAYINSARAVARFMNSHVRNLSNVFADRIQVSIAPDSDIKLEYVFKLQPSPQPLTIGQGFIPLGSLHRNRPISVLMQFELPPGLSNGFRSVARIVTIGDILAERISSFHTMSDTSVEVAADAMIENPPTAILDALGKLTLYRMQERAQEALEQGDVRKATQHLENLAARLAALGETELAQQARSEAQQVAHTAALTDKGRKTLKYQTRHLLLGSDGGEVG